MDRVFIKSLFSSDTAFSLPVRHKYQGNMREELTWPEEVASLSDLLTGKFSLSEDLLTKIISSHRWQCGGFLRWAWHPKPAAVRTMSTKRRYLLGRIRLADERDVAGRAMAPSRNIAEDCS